MVINGYHYTVLIEKSEVDMIIKHSLTEILIFEAV